MNWLRQLDAGWGATGVVMRRDERRELEMQAANGDREQIDPDLEQRGRAWADPLVRPLRQQRFLLAEYTLSLLFAAVFAVFGFLGYPTWGGVVVMIAIPLTQTIKRRRLRPEAQRLLDVLPPPRARA